MNKENITILHEYETLVSDIAEKLNTLSDKILYSNNDIEVKDALKKRYEELMNQKFKYELQIKNFEKKHSESL
jgi:hypothetical protein